MANKGAPLSHDVLKYYRQIKQLIDGGELGEDEQASLISNVYKVRPNAKHPPTAAPRT